MRSSWFELCRSILLGRLAGQTTSPILFRPSSEFEVWRMPMTALKATRRYDDFGRPGRTLAHWHSKALDPELQASNLWGGFFPIDAM